MTVTTRKAPACTPPSGPRPAQAGRHEPIRPVRGTAVHCGCSGGQAADAQLGFCNLLLGCRGEACPDEGPTVNLTAQFAGEERIRRGRAFRAEGETGSRPGTVNATAEVQDSCGQGGLPSFASGGGPVLAIRNLGNPGARRGPHSSHLAPRGQLGPRLAQPRSAPVARSGTAASPAGLYSDPRRTRQRLPDLPLAARRGSERNVGANC